MTTEQKLLDWYTERFEREYRDAHTEFLRLSELFKDVCWYNFETRCRTWGAPWRATRLDSPIELLGMHFERKWNRGCLFEHGHFPAYYAGTVGEAPPLPPEILLHELKEAQAYMEACQQQITAPYDWAPGGRLYEQLARQTLVGKCGTSSVCVYAPSKRKAHQEFSSC